MKYKIWIKNVILLFLILLNLFLVYKIWSTNFTHTKLRLLPLGRVKHITLPVEL